LFVFMTECFYVFLIYSEYLYWVIAIKNVKFNQSNVLGGT